MRRVAPRDTVISGVVSGTREVPCMLCVILLACTIAVHGIGGCESSGNVPVGATCTASSECASSLCMDGICVDPSADPDGDGLINAVEEVVGSNVNLGDTDADGILDPQELGPNLTLTDTDKDGKPDIIESAIDDADKDCITDQFDPRDDSPDVDKSPMVDLVCPREGICLEQRDRMRVTCPDGKTAVCVLDDVVGYSDPEVCDGRDDDCDGDVEEYFPDGCDQTATPFVSAGSGGRTFATARYRATLVMGQPALKTGATTRYRVHIGNNPALAPRQDAGSAEERP